MSNTIDIPNFFEVQFSQLEGNEIHRFYLRSDAGDVREGDKIDCIYSHRPDISIRNTVKIVHRKRMSFTHPVTGKGLLVTVVEFEHPEDDIGVIQ